MLYRILIPSRSKREQIRKLALISWTVSRGDKESAIKLVSLKLVTSLIVASFLIKIAISLAVALIEYWFKNKIAIPATTFQVGEPGA